MARARARVKWGAIRNLVLRMLAVRGCATKRELAEAVISEFGIDKGTAVTDVKSVLRKLHSLGLIVKVKADGYNRYCIPYATSHASPRVE